MKISRIVYQRLIILLLLFSVNLISEADKIKLSSPDGKNLNIGLVDVTDRPYTELIEAAKKTHKRIYDIHVGDIQPTDRT